jgi:hypothetical protein
VLIKPREIYQATTHGTRDMLTPQTVTLLHLQMGLQVRETTAWRVEVTLDTLLPSRCSQESFTEERLWFVRTPSKLSIYCRENDKHCSDG